VRNLVTLSRCAIALAALGCVSAAYAQFSYTETFKNSSASGWNFYSGNSAPGPRLTSGASPTSADPEYGISPVIDNSGDGWLRLATTTANQSNAAYFDTALPSTGNTITVRFSVAMWGDRGEAAGGDGLTFFMRNAAQDFSVGAFGGSIGYAQKSGIDGVSGGYFGVALDVYGNYSNPTEGRVGGVGARPNAVVVRGPGTGQTGYNYLAGTSGYNYTVAGSDITLDAGDPTVAALPYSLSFPTAGSRPDQAISYRNVEITLSSSSQLSVNMQFGEDGVWRNVLNADMSSFSRPDMMAFGFSSGTGGANQVYEIGNSFSVEATAATNTYFWDNGSTNNPGIWGGDGDAENNWTSDTLPGARRNVVFNDAFIPSSPSTQIVTMTADRTVGSMYFSGENAYTINGVGSSRVLTFDAPGGATSHLAITNSATGSADHTINVDVAMVNDLIVDNYVANKTFTFGDVVTTGDNDLTIKGTGTTVFNQDVSGGGVLSKEDTGTLEFKSLVTVDAMALSGGTLRLDSASITASGALTISTDSIIDFGTVGGSTLNFGSLAILSGVTLTLTNWSNALDFFYVQSQPTAGTLSQIVFAGFGPAAWDPVSKQIRPVPEPATYGIILTGLVLVAFGAVRFQQQRRTARSAGPRRVAEVLAKG
jgi:fibronectin-binding autotransporter adhesin